jgi:hypothetical protein
MNTKQRMMDYSRGIPYQSFEDIFQECSEVHKCRLTHSFCGWDRHLWLSLSAIRLDCLLLSLKGNSWLQHVLVVTEASLLSHFSVLNQIRVQEIITLTWFTELLRGWLQIYLYKALGKRNFPYHDVQIDLTSTSNFLFSTSSRPVRRSTQPPSFPGSKAAGVWSWPLTSS